MPTVELDDNKWGQVMALISEAPWKVANPLLMEIGNQLRAQVQAASNPPNIAGIRLDANGKEVRDE